MDLDEDGRIDGDDYEPRLLEREQQHHAAGVTNTQTPGRIQKVDPPILGSSTPMV